MGWRESEVLAAVRGKIPNAQGWVRGNCPLCEERAGKADRKMSLGVCVRTQTYHCFKCGAQGKLHDAEDYLPTEEVGSEEPEQITAPEGFHLLSNERSTDALQPAWDYLRSRHVSEEMVEQLHIGACVRGKCRGRVVIPLFDQRGEWVWWVARVWVPKPSHQPYLYPSGPRGAILFNESALYVETDEPVLVTEGCFDALPHLPDVVACLGKPNHSHMCKFRSAKRPVVFGLDGDAWEEALGDCWRLMLDGVRTGAVHLPPKTDPHVTDKDELRDAARHAVGRSYSVDLR